MNYDLTKIGLLIVLVLTVFSSSIQISKSQWIRNGSFEQHKDTIYPRGLSGSDSYYKNHLMSCIGFCKNFNDVWPCSKVIGTVPPNSWNCDYNDTNSTNYYNGGWYWATKYASPDYFHKGGRWNAKVPNVSIFSVTYGTIPPEDFEMRQPYPSSDSAYIGLRMLTANNGKSNQINFESYKEYVQSSLIDPLVGPGIFQVKFFVSKSKFSNTIKKMCALFTETSYVNPVPDDDYYDNHFQGNLYVPFTNPRQFITEPQICSNEDLYMTADEFGEGGWQEISGTLFVPENETYHYITIGNFQADNDLKTDKTITNLYDSSLV